MKKEEKNKITQAVILSAGLGTRLRGVTNDAIPKVMVPILGKPLLAWHIERLKQFGVSDVFVNLFHLPDAITEYFGDGSAFGVRMRYHREEPQIMGTAGGVKGFEGALAGNFFVIYGDIVSLLDYGKMAEVFFAKPGAVGMEVVRPVERPQDSDLVEVDQNLLFLKIHPKPNATVPPNARSLGAIFIMNEKVLRHIPPGVPYDMDHGLLPELIAAGERFYGYETDDFLEDIGTVERYERVEAYLRSRPDLRSL